tara:strand:- start:3978 stop:4874 length:897 start_codon:yes stop_codon:yes gene_type:complete
MATLTKNHPDLLTDGFRKILFDEFGRYEDQYTQVFNIESSTKPDENDTLVGTLGLIPERNEGAAVVYDDPPAGFDSTYTHREFALGFQVTRIMLEDDQFRVMRRMPAQLGISLRQTIETDGANVLNNGFGTSDKFSSADGKALFADDHPLEGGGTEQNTLTSAADLSATSLEQALIDIAETTDDRGKKIALRPQKIVIPVNLQWTARKLLGSSLDPDSANNAINPASGILPFTVNNFLTDTDAWFIQCDRHQMNFFWRRRPDFDRDNDFETDNLRFKVTSRWSRGFSHWAGMYGSPGA